MGAKPNRRAAALQEVHGVPQAAAGPGGPAEAGGDRLDPQDRVGRGRRVYCRLGYPFPPVAFVEFVVGV